jgi:hypothetical protein
MRRRIPPRTRSDPEQIADRLRSLGWTEEQIARHLAAPCYKLSHLLTKFRNADPSPEPPVADDRE